MPNIDLLSKSPESIESPDIIEELEKSQLTSSITTRLLELWLLDLNKIIILLILSGHSCDGFLSWDWLGIVSSLGSCVDTGLDAHLKEEVFEVFIHLISGLDVRLVDSRLVIFFADLNGQLKDLSG